ncbi:hypothetical protein GCM10018772_68660 [Streptomyces fumanus]|uniref:Secreted protein n=1 Tax=Streptomyces fumanus TaxID=67302 RepID=A0A919EBD4_9ACTN|nr:hypothetical protein GCM10018772_68660 [Streptomyces fumanus]
MRLRQALATAALSGTLALGATTVPAQASESKAAFDYVLSTTNGSASVYVNRDSGGGWQVCDDDSDGMRAIAEVRYSTQVLRLQTTSGYGSCSSEQYLYPRPVYGAKISVKVWVQDGANGTPRYPNSGTYTW